MNVQEVSKIFGVLSKELESGHRSELFADPTESMGSDTNGTYLRAKAAVYMALDGVSSYRI